VGIYYWIRVGIMVVCFVVLVVTIRAMNSGQPVASPILSALGIKSGTGDGVKERITLCPTRVVSIESSDGILLSEQNMKWFRETKGDDRVELDTVAVEKWFGHHCTVSAESVVVTESAVDRGFTFTYVNGENAILSSVAGAPGVYRFAGRTFRSAELDAALRGFAELPLLKAPGTH
jgi:hypothetical protein